MDSSQGLGVGGQKPPAMDGTAAVCWAGQPCPWPALPVGFVLLGYLLCQLLQHSLFQGQILTKQNAAKVIYYSASTVCRHPHWPHFLRPPFTPLNSRLYFSGLGVHFYFSNVAPHCKLAYFKAYLGLPPELSKVWE